MLTAWRKQTLAFVYRTFSPNKPSFTSIDTIGTASMLPREKNGVVDSHLKVYGTRNIRVVDLSVVPLHIGAHTQGTSLIGNSKFIV